MLVKKTFFLILNLSFCSSFSIAGYFEDFKEKQASNQIARIAEKEKEYKENRKANLRWVNNQVYDFSIMDEKVRCLMKIINDSAAISESTDEAEKKIEAKVTIKEANEKIIACVQSYLVDGKVIQVIDDGLIIEDKTKQIVLLKDYENEKSITDDELIHALSVRIGRYQYKSLSGVVKTIPVFYAANPIPRSVDVDNVKINPLPY